MPSFAVVEGELSVQRGAGSADAVVGFQINLLLLHAAPQALDKDVVDPAALAVHADADVMLLERAGELLAGELTAQTLPLVNESPHPRTQLVCSPLVELQLTGQIHLCTSNRCCGNTSERSRYVSPLPVLNGRMISLID